MVSRENFFLYTFLCVPALSVLIGFCIRCIHILFETEEPVIHVVEPLQLVQQIHMTDPLAVAESVESEIDDHVQFALTLHSVPLSHHVTNQESLNI